MIFRSMSSVRSRFSRGHQLRGEVSCNRLPARAAGLLLLLLLFAVSMAGAQSYSDLYEFTGKLDGCCPSYPSLMAQGEDGNLYGITTAGGSNNLGIVFKITPLGAFTVL